MVIVFTRRAQRCSCAMGATPWYTGRTRCVRGDAADAQGLDSTRFGSTRLAERGEARREWASERGMTDD